MRIVLTLCRVCLQLMASLLSRGTALAVLVFAFCALSVDAAATCPAGAGANNAAISCYEGSTFSGTLPSGGLCTCKCGASSSVADYDYSAGSTNPRTEFQAADSSTCTPATCRTKYTNFCGSASSVGATYATFTAALAAGAPKSKAITGGQTICYTLTSTCTASALTTACPSYFTNGAITTYSYMQSDASMNVDATCTLSLSAVPQGSTFNTLCMTSNCNAPSSSSAAVRGAGVGTTVAAAVIVAALAAASL